MASQRNLSHAEIWDDSALVDSWNEALEEYKHYHSIHARGEKVEVVLKTHKQGDGVNGEIDCEECQVEDHRSPADDQHAKIIPEAQDQVKTAVGNDSQVKEEPSGPSGPEQAYPGPNNTENATSKVQVPQHLIGQVEDEGLKNLLMSWYYAGYYTGLYEGKKQQQGKHEA